MATQQNGGPLRIIGCISKFVGTLIGSVVIAVRRIIESGSTPVVAKAKGPVKGRKKAADKPVGKGPKKKKKVVKRKGTGSSSKSETSKKKPAQSPAEKKKVATPKKKKARSKTKKTTKNKAANHSQGSLISETADKDITSANVSPKESTEKKDTTRSQRPSIPIIEYNNEANKAVVAVTSVL